MSKNAERNRQVRQKSLTEGQPRFIDVQDTSLEQWLEMVFEPPENSVFCTFCFPTGEHKDEYVDTIGARPDIEIRRLLLKFLVPSGSLGADGHAFEYLMAVSQEDHQRLLEIQFYRRLFLHSLSSLPSPPPWEGITWILDLLPHQPKTALEVLQAYTSTHIQFLPDGRLHGLHDASEIIRAKYIGLPGTQEERVQLLRGLSPRSFERVIERLYHALGYETELTPERKDGGRDVVAVKQAVGQREKLLVECKSFENNVGVEYVLTLLGVIHSEKANKGVLVATSGFTEDSRQFAESNHLELIEGDQVVSLLNEHLGSRWPLQIERLALESETEAGRGSSRDTKTQ